MSETKFTGGPLGFERRDNYVPLSELKFMVTKNAAYTALVPIEADARLYAAAPDLYAVVVRVAAAAERFSKADAPLGVAARAALAKANGEL